MAVLFALGLTIYECFFHTNDGVAAPGRYSPILLVYSGSRFFIALVAATLLLKPVLRPDESRLFNGLIGLSLDLLYNFYPVAWPVWLTAAITNAGVGFGIAELIRYAAGFFPAGKTARAAATFGIAAGASLALAGYVPVVLYFVLNMADAPYARVARVLANLRWALLLIAVVGLEAIAIRTWVIARADRARRFVAALGFAPLTLTSAAHAGLYLAVGDSSSAQTIDVLGYALTATVLVYGTASGSLIDALSAAVTATITAAVLTLVAFLAEHFIAPLIETAILTQQAFSAFGEQVRNAVELGVAFCIFLGIDKLHEWSADFTRGLIFRHRAEHIAALRQFAEDVSGEPPDQIGRRLVAAAIDDAGAPAAALYVRRGSHFKLIAAHGEADELIGFDDARVPELRRARTCSDGSIVLPMPIGTMLTGFLHCRTKPSGEGYAADETALLALATREAGLLLRRS